MFKIQTLQADGSWFDKRAKLSDPDSVILFPSYRHASIFIGDKIRHPSKAGAMRIVPA